MSTQDKLKVVFRAAFFVLAVGIIIWSAQAYMATPTLEPYERLVMTHPANPGAVLPGILFFIGIIMAFIACAVWE